MHLSPSSIPASRLLAHLRVSTSMFNGRINSTTRRGRPIGPIFDEIIRYLTNVANKYGLEYSAYCISYLADPDPYEGKILQLIYATRRLRQEPRIARWVSDSVRALSSTPYGAGTDLRDAPS